MMVDTCSPARFPGEASAPRPPVSFAEMPGRLADSTPVRPELALSRDLRGLSGAPIDAWDPKDNPRLSSPWWNRRAT